MSRWAAIPSVERMTSSSIDTRLAEPGHPDYDDATAAFNLHPRVTPAKAVVARSVGEVVAAVRAATAEGRRVSVISTGHSIATAQPLDGAVLVRTALDEPVVIDPDAQTATIPAGALWADVVAAAAQHGLAAPHGSSGTVGAIGYLLRGGISFYGREIGVASNSVLSITLVRADGAIVVTSATQHAELFWALRGGGGGFGIVTSVTVRLRPMWKVLTGITFWDAEHAEELLNLWTSWSATAPPAVSSSFRILRLPPLPGVPDAIAGRVVVAVDGAVTVRDPYMLSSRTQVMHDLLDPLRAVAAPLVDDWDLRDPALLPMTHMDPADPIPYVGDHLLVGELDSDDVARIIETVGVGSTSAVTSVELRQLGGAFAERDSAGGAFNHTRAAFAILAVGAVGGPLTADLQHDTMARLRAALAHRDTGFTAPTFVESATQPSRTFDDGARAEVDAVRARVDPDGVFAPAIVPFVGA